MTYEQLIVDRDGGVATVSMNNPARLNALSATLSHELMDAVASLGHDPEVRAIVLTGEGRGFCVGADLTTLQEPYLKGERPKLSGFLREGYNRLIPALAGAPKPVVAAINGVAAGAGISLALACDVRIASEEASFNSAFVKIGLVPDSGACWFLPRAVGMTKALELAITGDRVDAKAALEMGLVNRLVPADHVLAEAQAYAARLAELPTTAIGLIKQILRQAAQLTLEETLELEADYQDRAGATDDHIEGVLAFLEKRPARFTGH
jgi:2-(1,2-epoxy-1,2-dihydrophenyl)acetyl-CoA isomerase